MINKIKEMLGLEKKDDTTSEDYFTRNRNKEIMATIVEPNEDQEKQEAVGL